MDFISWLDDNLSWEYRLEGCGKVNGDVLLKDQNDVVKVRVRNVGSAVIVIPEDMGQWRIFRPGEWDKRSDFIVLGDRPGYGQYVFLIELKATARTIEEHKNNEERRRRKDGIEMEHQYISLYFIHVYH